MFGMPGRRAHSQSQTASNPEPIRFGVGYKQTGPTIRGSDSETELLLELRLRCLYIFRHLPEPDNSIAIGSWASIERRLRGTSDDFIRCAAGLAFVGLGLDAAPFVC